MHVGHLETGRGRAQLTNVVSLKKMALVFRVKKHHLVKIFIVSSGHRIVTSPLTLMHSHSMRMHSKPAKTRGSPKTSWFILWRLNIHCPYQKKKYIYSTKVTKVIGIHALGTMRILLLSYLKIVRKCGMWWHFNSALQFSESLQAFVASFVLYKLTVCNPLIRVILKWNDPCTHRSYR